MLYLCYAREIWVLYPAIRWMNSQIQSRCEAISATSSKTCLSPIASTPMKCSSLMV